MKMSKFEIKEKLVKVGASKIFRNWNKFAGITEEEFIDGLRWLCADPMDGGSDGNRLTRELGCIASGPRRGLHRLKRCYYGNDFAGFYEEADGHLWVSCAGVASISADDRI